MGCDTECDAMQVTQLALAHKLGEVLLVIFRHFHE